MGKVVAHLGAHKTGTSLIQKYMRDRPNQLVPHGIVPISRGDTNSLIGWGKALLEQPSLLEERLSLELAREGARYIVISHENTLGRPHRPSGTHLYPQAEPRIRSLARILRPFDHQVIFYLRPQASFLESYYLQLVQQGSFATFEAWLETVDLDLVSWRPVVEMLRAEFGEERVSIADFGEIYSGQEHFLRSFFFRIDDSISVNPEYTALRNASISAKGLAIALAANPFLRNAEERSQMRDFLQRHFSNATYPRPRLFTDEQRRDLGNRYDDEYRELVDRG